MWKWTPRGLWLICFLVCALAGKAEDSPVIRARYGMNFYQPKDWNREQPFINVMKTSRAWISQSEGKWDDVRPLVLDRHGYVAELAPGQWAGTVMLTEVGDSFPGGEYVFLYDGEGTFEWKGNARRSESAPGRDIVDVTPRQREFVHLVITSLNPTNYPRNMRFVRAALEEVYASQPFTPEFLDLWRDVDTLRFMDWTLTNHSEQREWDARPLPDDCTYSTRGVPWEVILQLMHALDANGWINIPHLATDDYIRQLAELFRDGAPPGQTVYYEFSNEVWNGMFEQTRYAQRMGQELGLDEAAWRAGACYHAIDCGRMFNILDEVYKDTPRDRYRKVIATQGANLGFARLVVTTFDVYRNADALAIAPYLTFNVPYERSEWQPDMPTADEVAGWNLDQVFDYLQTHALPQCLKWMDDQMALAEELGLELIAYEGGQHLTALGQANQNEQLVALLSEANRDPRMGDLYTKYFTHWTQIGGGVFCHFNAVNHHSQHGYWGLLEYLMQDPQTSPKYRAIKSWAAGLEPISEP